MDEQRHFSCEERAVIATLLNARPQTRHLLDQLDDLLAVEMKDGGMGSLLLFPPGPLNDHRKMGSQIVTGEFSDSDGMPVLIAINLDQEERLYELDSWKVDFSPLLRWPDPANIRIDEQPCDDGMV
jgi:hypothetical protein